MLKCREVTRLLTLEPEQPISTYRQISIALHLMICHNCRRHRKQLRQIRHWLDQESASEIESADHPLDPAARERIAEQLSNARPQD